MKRGSGALSSADQDRALDMLREGKTQVQVALRLGVTKNTIAGVWKRAGMGEARGPDPSTLLQRCAALHAKMDAVLAETRGVGDQAKPRCPLAWQAAVEILDEISMERMARRDQTQIVSQGLQPCPRAPVDLDDEIPF